MQESSLINFREFRNWPENEIFSDMVIPPLTSFFVRLDGWRFKKVSETIKAEKPFDQRFAKCLVHSAKALFKKGFNPALIYVVSDEVNVLFAGHAPFRGRVEKINSVTSGIVSSAFTLHLQKFFGKGAITSFDSRIVMALDLERIVKYIVWRQMNAWRNHNNAYAYWILRRMGYTPSKTAEMLAGMRFEEINKLGLRHGVNLAKTPLWQRRGILIYKKPCMKRGKGYFIRWKIKENWNLPLFTSENGVKTLRQIIEWANREGKTNC
jgi:tRNA(His) 5'-end guanylyltransferase